MPDDTKSLCVATLVASLRALASQLERLDVVPKGAYDAAVANARECEVTTTRIRAQYDQHAKAWSDDALRLNVENCSKFDSLKVELAAALKDAEFWKERHDVLATRLDAYDEASHKPRWYRRAFETFRNIF